MAVKTYNLKFVSKISPGFVKPYFKFRCDDADNDAAALAVLLACNAEMAGYATCNLSKDLVSVNKVAIPDAKDTDNITRTITLLDAEYPQMYFQRINLPYCQASTDKSLLPAALASAGIVHPIDASRTFTKYRLPGERAVDVFEKDTFCTDSTGTVGVMG